MSDIKELLADRFPEHRQVVADLGQGNAAFNVLAEEYGRLSRRLDSLSSPDDPQAAAEAENLRHRLVDLDSKLLALIEQNARV